MEKYIRPILYCIVGVLIGVSIGVRADRGNSQSEFSSTSIPSVLTIPTGSTAPGTFSLFGSLKIAIETDRKKNAFALSTTFDQLMILETPFRQPVLPMTDEGKEIIDAVRDHHTKTELISNERNNEFLCAGYIYELTARLWGPKAPQRVGLLNPKARQACDAREIPYCYEYYGGKITYDMGIKHGPALQKDAESFSDIVTPEEMIRFFAAAFRPGALLGDIGFLFRNSHYLYMLGAYDNYNTHITKNMGLSKFTVNIEYPSEETGVSNDLLLRNALGCKEAMRPLIKPLLTRYSFEINGQPARYMSDGSVMLVDKENKILTPYALQTLDSITYTDIALAHFYGGENVDSLLQMSCQGEFFPINVIEINPKFIEKY